MPSSLPGARWHAPGTWPVVVVTALTGALFGCAGPAPSRAVAAPSPPASPTWEQLARRIATVRAALAQISERLGQVRDANTRVAVARDILKVVRARAFDHAVDGAFEEVADTIVRRLDPAMLMRLRQVHLADALVSFLATVAILGREIDDADDRIEFGKRMARMVEIAYGLIEAITELALIPAEQQADDELHRELSVELESLQQALAREIGRHEPPAPDRTVRARRIP